MRDSAAISLCGIIGCGWLGLCSAAAYPFIGNDWLAIRL